MSNTRVSQSYKSVLVGGGPASSKASQAHKIVLLTIGSAPSVVSSSHMVYLITPTTGRRRGFMNFNPEQGADNE